MTHGPVEGNCGADKVQLNLFDPESDSFYVEDKPKVKEFVKNLLR